MKSQFLRYGLLFALALAAFGTLAGCDKAEQVMEKTDLGTTSELTSFVTKAVETLGGIKDVDSAKAVLPALKQMDIDLESIIAKVSEMSPEQKSQLTGAVGKVMPQFEGAIAKVTSMNGVGAVVGPTLESLQNKFKNMM